MHALETTDINAKRVDAFHVQSASSASGQRTNSVLLSELVQYQYRLTSASTHGFCLQFSKAGRPQSNARILWLQRNLTSGSSVARVGAKEICGQKTSATIRTRFLTSLMLSKATFCTKFGHALTMIWHEKKGPSEMSCQRPVFAIETPAQDF